MKNRNSANAQSADKRQNEIIRIQKKRNNFVMLDKGFLEDNRLSFKAKGLLAYVLSKPDNWKVIVKDLVNNSTDGKSAIYSGLRELKEHGYYKKEPVRDEKGQIIYWESVIYECPEEKPKSPPEPPKSKDYEKKSLKSPIPPLVTDFQDIDNQYQDNPNIENREHNNINISNQLSDQKIISIYPSENQESETATPPIDTIDNRTYTPDEVADKISLDELKATYHDRHDEVNMLYDIVCDVLTNPNPSTPTFRISKQNIPYIIVKNTFETLDKSHFEYVLDCLHKNDNKHKIKGNTKSYLMTALFHSPRTITYYHNRMFNKPQPPKDIYAEFIEKQNTKFKNV